MTETKVSENFSLDDEHAQMGKISNNLEVHGNEEVVAFAIPYELMLAEPQLDALMGKYFWRSLFNVDAQTNLPSPVSGFLRCKPLELEDVYEEVTVTLSDGHREEEFKGCRVSKGVFEPQVGGLTKLKLQVYLRPDIGPVNLWLQELQHREVSISLSEGKIAKKKSAKQQSLPLEQPKDGKVTVGSDAKLDDQVGRPPEVESRGGDAIDAELHARHPEASGEVMGAEAHPDPGSANGSGDANSDDATGLARFTEGATKSLQEFTNVATTGAIDGRSERVKHEDRKRGRGGKAA